MRAALRRGRDKWRWHLVAFRYSMATQRAQRRGDDAEGYLPAFDPTLPTGQAEYRGPQQ